MATAGTGARGNYARGLATREQIVDAARDVILERGFYGATMGAIAERAGLTRAGVLHHFDSKEHLLLAAMEARFAEYNVWYARQVDAGLDVLDIQVAFMERQVQSPESATLLIGLAGASIDANHPAHRWFQDRYRYIRDSLIVFTREGQEAGRIRDETAPDLLALQILGVMEGLLLHWLIDKDAFDPVAALRSYADSLRPT